MAVRVFFQKIARRKGIQRLETGTLTALIALAAVLALALAAAAGLAGMRYLARPVTGAGAAVEVVNTRPLQAVHNLPEGASAPEQGSLGLAEGRAQVELPVDFYDFGGVGAREVAQHEFLILNRGDAPLILRGAYTTCGCTRAQISASVIPPGKAARAVIIFDAGYHPAAGQTVRRGLILQTNDLDRPEVEIWVQARVGQ